MQSKPRSSTQVSTKLQLVSSSPAATPAAMPTLDQTLAILVHSVSPSQRWALEGWATHLRASRHQNHAANSMAKHEAEFDALHTAAAALTLARCIDFGMSADEARALLDERRAARVARCAA